MNDLMQDVKELKAIRESVGLYSTSTIKSFFAGYDSKKNERNC